MQDICISGEINIHEGTMKIKQEMKKLKANELPEASEM